MGHPTDATHPAPLGGHSNTVLPRIAHHVHARYAVAVFVPLGIVNFRFVPLAWRTPVLSVFGLVFPIALSFQRGKGE